MGKSAENSEKSAWQFRSSSFALDQSPVYFTIHSTVFRVDKYAVVHVLYSVPSGRDQPVSYCLFRLSISSSFSFAHRYSVQSRVTKTMIGALLDPAMALVSQYGAVWQLIELGPLVLDAVLIDNLAAIGKV